MPEFIMIHNLINSETGRTFKEDNLLTLHKIPVGALVEIISSGDALADDGRTDVGVRLHVIKQGRDVDGTPLYWLGINGFSKVDESGLANRVFGGYSEESLSVVQLPTNDDADS